jgi:beta-lactamase class A
MSVSSDTSPGHPPLTGFHILLIACAPFAAGCAGNAATSSRDSSSPLTQQIQRIAATIHGNVGVAVLSLGSNDSTLVRGDDRFPMHSVYKLPIAMAVLREVDLGRMRLDQPIRIEADDLAPPAVYSPIRDQYPRGGVTLTVEQLLRPMIELSDSTASDLFLRLLGDPNAVTRYLRSVGIEDIVVATTEREMAADDLAQYRSWATPAGMLRLLAALHDEHPISDSSRAKLIQWMTDAQTGPNRLKGLLPAGTVVAHKTGTAPTIRGLTRATNDVGYIRLPDGRVVAVAVFISDSPDDTAARERVIAQVARAVWDHYANPASTTCCQEVELSPRKPN